MRWNCSSLVAIALLLAVTGAQAQNRVPSERSLEALVKTSLLTFNDANLTGNYAVFQARLSKPFRQQFSAERLRERFREFAEKEIDLGVVAALKPAYAPPPSVDSEGRLLVRGSFPTEPNRVNFELDYIPSDGEWKLIRINVKVGAPP